MLSSVLLRQMKFHLLFYAIAYCRGNAFINPVHSINGKRRQIDLCRFLGRMPQPFADEGNRYSLILCYGGPRMACHIGGERKVYVQQSPKLLEVTVYHPQSIAILRINGS